MEKDIIIKEQTVTKLLTYKEVLEKLAQSKTNHLLIANGFNYGLGVNTGYKAIFEQMVKENQGQYESALPMIKKCYYDLEDFIGALIKDINKDNIFLKNYINNKVKLDFMKATHEIVKSKIKNIYAEKNEGIFILLHNFTNYFTLNYDPLLYLLLLKYKISNNENNTFAIDPQLSFVEENMDVQQNNIYSEIKNARINGKLYMQTGDNLQFENDLKKVTKVFFTESIKQYCKKNKKGWKTKDINKVINIIWEEEKKNQLLENVDDGSRMLFPNADEYTFINNKTQNLFFLHGAFHIYRNGHEYKKITKSTDKALYDKLENILNNEKQDIICVFQSTNKINTINKNKYLRNCLNKLKGLSGNLVIIGSSLADNDNHIFNQINNSNIKDIFISAIPEQKESIKNRAISFFPKKNIYLFNAKTISYEMPKELV